LFNTLIIFYMNYCNFTCIYSFYDICYLQQAICIYIYIFIYLFYFAYLVHLLYLLLFVFDDHFFIYGCTSCNGFTERLRNEWINEFLSIVRLPSDKICDLWTRATSFYLGNLARRYPNVTHNFAPVKSGGAFHGNGWLRNKEWILFPTLATWRYVCVAMTCRERYTNEGLKQVLFSALLNPRELVVTYCNASRATCSAMLFMPSISGTWYLPESCTFNYIDVTREIGVLAL
jgi:hypothetical protein